MHNGRIHKGAAARAFKVIMLLGMCSGDFRPVNMILHLISLGVAAKDTSKVLRMHIAASLCLKSALILKGFSGEFNVK
jgi:hypothetical protein